VLWATKAGLGVGGALGTAVGKLVLYMRRTHREAVGLDDFLALGRLPSFRGSRGYRVRCPIRFRASELRNQTDAIRDVRKRQGCDAINKSIRGELEGA
jgi:hypothetical protein